MNPRWPHARVAIPTFRSSPPDRSTGLRPRALASDRTEVIDHAHMARANGAASIRRREGAVFEAYAHCDRAPLGWENPSPQPATGEING